MDGQPPTYPCLFLAGGVGGSLPLGKSRPQSAQHGGRPLPLLLANVIRELRPRRVIEVAAGDGLNLIVLASFLPEVEFEDLELTEGGVATARAFQTERLPTYVAGSLPQPMQSVTAFRSIAFQQGDILELGSRPDSFELVFTCVGVEQMEAFRSEALDSVRRASRKWIAMLEPFFRFQCVRDHTQIRRKAPVFSRPASTNWPRSD